MTEKIKIILSIIFFFLLVAGTGAALAANSLWTQTDWSGGADQSQSARHPDNQTNWNKYFSTDPYTNIPINTSVSGQISLSPQPASKKQTSDVGDFDTGKLTNLRLVGTGGITSAWYEDNSSSVTKTGYWRFGTSTLASGNYSNNYSFSDETGAAATFTFTGSEVSWIGQKGRAYGIASVFLDGVWRQDVDLYNTNIIQFQQLLFSISGLTNTTHTLRIEVTGRRNPSASGPRVGVDAFDIVTLFPDEGAYLRLEDDIPDILNGFYESPTFDTGDFGAIFSTISWNASVPPGSDLKFHIATNASRDN